MDELVYVFAIILAVLAVIAAIGAAVGRGFGGKAKGKDTFWCLFVSSLCVLVSAANYVWNAGWIRIMMTWILLPFWYVLLLFIASKSASACISDKWVKAMFIVSHVCFVASSLLLPDFGDETVNYMFFGQIDDASEYFIGVSALLFVVSIVLMIVMIAIACGLKAKNRTTQ